MTPPESAVAVELERLRGDLGRDLAEIKGSLAVLVERSNRAEADIRQLREDTERGLQQAREESEVAAAVLRGEVEELKRNRWPLPTIGALAGVAGAATGVFALLVK